jgi:diadenosine tetraphosphate (Ap4A) HIT family hydrolase
MMSDMRNKSTCPFSNPDNSLDLMDNNHAVAIPDRFPITPGHTLIIPKRHTASFFEATRGERTAKLDLLAEMRQRLLEERNSDGFNNGATVGQTVMHLHIHLIPRYDGDMSDPLGGVRWIFPDKTAYWAK